MLRGFRRPRLWIAMWLVMFVGVIVLSLMPGPPIPAELVIGKLDHGIAYFCLVAMAVQIFPSWRQWFSAALLAALLGVSLEVAQGVLTDYRHMSAYDAIIDCFGAALGLATGWTPLRHALLTIDRWLPAPRR
ncbi:MAG: VanZ family protein [Proteobacteria bacterium]|nr:VanZ family protein [Pseudomonadota bacterium]MBS0461204.1 VanZ family protein [Pseudomonadota bacterium]